MTFIAIVTQKTLLPQPLQFIVYLYVVIHSSSSSPSFIIVLQGDCALFVNLLLP